MTSSYGWLILITAFQVAIPGDQDTTYWCRLAPVPQKSQKHHFIMVSLLKYITPWFLECPWFNWTGGCNLDRFKSDPLAAFSFRALRSERKSSKRVRFESDYGGMGRIRLAVITMANIPVPSHHCSSCHSFKKINSMGPDPQKSGTDVGFMGDAFNTLRPRQIVVILQMMFIIEWKLLSFEVCFHGSN